MPDQTTPHAAPIPQTGEAAWFPPAEDDRQASGPSPAPLKNTHWVFFGKDGLRAGWSTLLFLVPAFIVYKSLGLLLGLLLGPSPRTPEQPLSLTFAAELIPFAFTLLIVFLLSILEKRRLTQYGLGSLRRRLGQFIYGAALGFLLLSSLIFLLRTSGYLILSEHVLHGVPAVRWGLLWALAFLAVALFEEYLTRGFLLFTASRGIAGLTQALGLQRRASVITGFWIAASLFSLLFGLGHLGNPGESLIGIVSANLIGLAFAFSLWRTGSLWWAIGYHAAWDWAQSFVYGVADSGTMVQHHLMASHPQGPTLLSGGLTGPEGSVFVLGECLLTALVIAFTLRSEPGSPSDPAYSPNALPAVIVASNAGRIGEA